LNAGQMALDSTETANKLNAERVALKSTKKPKIESQAGGIKQYRKSQRLNAERVALRNTKKPTIECQAGVALKSTKKPDFEC